MYDKSDLCYMAGLVDGEGHFYLPLVKNGRGERYPQARIIVVQSTKNDGKELFDWVMSKFGGGLHFYEKSGMYRWTIQGRAATKLALALQPYLKVKREQVKRVLV